jgi:hypothetical protein
MKTLMKLLTSSGSIHIKNAKGFEVIISGVVVVIVVGLFALAALALYSV